MRKTDAETFGVSPEVQAERFAGAKIDLVHGILDDPTGGTLAQAKSREAINTSDCEPFYKPPQGNGDRGRFVLGMRLGDDRINIAEYYPTSGVVDVDPGALELLAQNPNLPEEVARKGLKDLFYSCVEGIGTLDRQYGTALQNDGTIVLAHTTTPESY